MLNGLLVIDRVNCRLRLSLLHRSGLFSRHRADRPGRRSRTGSLQPGWCSPAPACSSPVPPGSSRTASTSRSNPSPPSISPPRPQPTTLALATTLPSTPSITPAAVPSSSLTLNLIPMLLITSTTTTTDPVQGTTPARASCTIGTPPARLNRKRLRSSLLDRPPTRNRLSCRNLHPLPKLPHPCPPLIHHHIPRHAPPRAPLSSHPLLHRVVLTDPAHLLSPREPSLQM